MKLRTLKKKSKQALPLLKHYHDVPEVFIAKKGDSYHEQIIRCSHHPRPHCGSHELINGEQVFTQRRLRCGCGWHPLKGTPMVGEVSGYYEPEWSERTAFDELCNRVLWHDRAETMTDAEWALALRITGCTPITEDDINEMLRDDFDEETAP